MFTGKLNTDITIINDISFDNNIPATIGIDAIRIEIVICRIRLRGNIIYNIAETNSVMLLIKAFRPGSFKPNKIDSNIVIIMDNIIGDNEICNVSI